MGSFVTFIIHLTIQYWKRTHDAQCNIIWQQLWVSAHLHMEYLGEWSFHNRCEPSQWHDNDHRTHTHTHTVCARECACLCVKQTSSAQWGCNTQLLHCISMLWPSWATIKQFKLTHMELLKVAIFNHIRWFRHYFKIRLWNTWLKNNVHLCRSNMLGCSI